MSAKRSIEKVKIHEYISQGLAASEIALLESMSSPTVKRIVRTDYSNLYEQLICNGRAKQLAHCRSIRRKK